MRAVGTGATNPAAAPIAKLKTPRRVESVRSGDAPEERRIEQQAGRQNPQTTPPIRKIAAQPQRHEPTDDTETDKEAERFWADAAAHEQVQRKQEDERAGLNGVNTALVTPMRTTPGVRRTSASRRWPCRRCGACAVSAASTAQRPTAIAAMTIHAASNRNGVVTPAPW